MHLLSWSHEASTIASWAQAGFSDVFEEFDKHGISCDVYFIDSRLQTWLVPAALVYSRTPADFEFKLPDTGLLLGDAHALAAHLRTAVDIAFPVVHGVFGEDGQLGAALRRVPRQIFATEKVQWVQSTPRAACSCAPHPRPLRWV